MVIPRTITLIFFAWSDRGVCEHSTLQIVQEFRRRFHPRHQQVVPSPSAGDVKQVGFRGINLFEICIVSNRLYSLLERNDLVVTPHHDYRAEL